jgi:hypothetical protein
MGDGTHIMRFEGPHDLEVLGQDPDGAICAAEEHVV